MEYVFRLMLGCAVTFVGCMISILATSQRIRQCKLELKRLREQLTKPESYVWIDVSDHLPKRDGRYLVEYEFVDFPLSSRYATVTKYYSDEQCFNVNPREMRVVRWAKLPK